MRMCLPEKDPLCWQIIYATECDKLAQFVVLRSEAGLMHRSCQWHVNARRCQNKSEPFRCHLVHNQRACRATKNCMFGSVPVLAGAHAAQLGRQEQQLPHASRKGRAVASIACAARQEYAPGTA